MLHFRSRKDAETADLPPVVRATILKRIDEFLEVYADGGPNWNPDVDGHFSFIEVEEAGEPLREMGWDSRLVDLLFEFVHFHEEARLWEAIYIPNDGWGWSVFVPDSPVLLHDLRELFLRETSPEEAEQAGRFSP